LIQEEVSESLSSSLIQDSIVLILHHREVIAVLFYHWFWFGIAIFVLFSILHWFRVSFATNVYGLCLSRCSRVLHSECMFLQGARVCSWKMQECVIGVLIEQVNSLVEFLCLLARRLDIDLPEEWTNINLSVLDLSHLYLDSQPETA